MAFVWRYPDMDWWMWALVALGAWTGVSLLGGWVASRLFQWLRDG
jgi:predicted lysophospholipase L1 biosynthesis ABC-type transport system permease subunit